MTTTPPAVSETPETKEDYEILTAWLAVNDPNKPSLRVPVKCIRLTTYERLERRLLEAEAKLGEAVEERDGVLLANEAITQRVNDEIEMREAAERKLAQGVVVPVVYTPCNKHSGLSWHLAAEWGQQFRAVCPVCEPPSVTAAEGDWK